MKKAEIWAVVPAGGSGSRFSAHQDKLLASLGGKPVLVRTVESLLGCSMLAGIVIVASQQNQALYQAVLSEAFPAAPLLFAVGGASRRASVYQGLLALPEAAEIVVIHDAARPLVRLATLQAAIEGVKAPVVGTLAAIPVVDTIKKVGSSGIVQRTVDRATLWKAQTPQVFMRSLLQKAHEQVSSSIESTDDAQLMELAGLGPIQIIPGSESNLKITGLDDLPLAESFLNAQAQTPLV
jgi:2-C-methyl-D-erythritol 4-phosphate cytidylyltransferase